MAKQIRYGTYADFQPEKMVTAELACVISGDPAVSDGMSLYICFSPGVVKRITTYSDFEREIQNATQEIQDAFTEDVRAAIQSAVDAANNANAAVTQVNEARDQALSAAESAEEAAEAALAAAGGDISEKTVTFDSQDAEDPEEWTDVDVLSTGTILSLLFQKVSSMFKNIRFLKKKTDELDLGVNELNTEISNAPGFGKVYATTTSITADANSGGWALVGPFDSAPYYPVAVIPMTAMYATSPICLTSAYHVKITSWNGDNVPLPITIDAFVLWAKI